MTEYLYDGVQVSFAAASIYPHEPSLSISAPQRPGPDKRRAPRPVDGDPSPSGTAVSSRRCSRAPAPDDDDVDALDIPTICRRSKTGRSYVYEEIRAGRLIARKFGRLTRVLQRDY